MRVGRQRHARAAVTPGKDPVPITLCTDWVQNVPRRGIFLHNSRWYRVTILPIFLFVRLNPTDTK